MSTDVQHYKQMYFFVVLVLFLFFAGLKQFTGHLTMLCREIIRKQSEQ